MREAEKQVRTMPKHKKMQIAGKMEDDNEFGKSERRRGACRG
jgi:hypothetical protein